MQRTSPRLHAAATLCAALSFLGEACADDARGTTNVAQTHAANADADTERLERAAESEIALAARGAAPERALAAVNELAQLARADAAPARRVARLGALARQAGALATVGSEPAVALRDEALAALADPRTDAAALLAFLERFGRGQALAIGLEPSETFLDQLAARTPDPRVKAACSAARALAEFEAVDSLGKERVSGMRAALARVAAELAGTRWARRAEAALYHWDHLRIQRVAPEFTGVDDAGRDVKLSALRGKTVALVFFTGDDERTRAQITAAQAWTKTYAGRPLAVLGVDGTDDPELASRWSESERALLERRGRVNEFAELADDERAFFTRLRAADVTRVHTRVQALGVTWPVVADGGSDGVWTSRWNVVESPTVVLIDAQGRIRYRNLPADELSLSLAALVQEAETAARAEKR